MTGLVWTILDRAYAYALRDADVPSDPRIGPSATYDWVTGVHTASPDDASATGRPADDPPVLWASGGSVGTHADADPERTDIN